MKVSINSQKNNTETVTNQNDQETLREKYTYISLEERQNIIDDLRLI